MSETVLHRLADIASRVNLFNSLSVILKEIDDTLDGHALLDAHVYRSCLECGDTRATPKPYGDERDRGRTFSACPVCKDAPVAIVEAALREKAMRESWLAYHRVVEGDRPDDELIAEVLIDSGVLHESYVKNMGVLVDAVLSTVLGKVRVAKRIGSIAGIPSETELVAAGIGDRSFVKPLPPGLYFDETRLFNGDAIAILEEAGKEE